MSIRASGPPSATSRCGTRSKARNDSPHVTSFLLPKGALSREGHEGAPSWPLAARRRLKAMVSDIDFQTLRFAYARHKDQDAEAAARHPVVVVGAGPVGLSLAI